LLFGIKVSLPSIISAVILLGLNSVIEGLSLGIMLLKVVCFLILYAPALFYLEYQTSVISTVSRLIVSKILKTILLVRKRV